MASTRAAEPPGDGADGYVVPSWSRVEGTLMATARAVRRAYDRALGRVGLNLAEASVLAHLARSPGLTQVVLARRIGTSRARVGAHIDSLEHKGAVRRSGDPADRRVWVIELTERGRELWLRAVDVDQAVRTVLRDEITKKQLAALDSTLALVQANASTLLEDQPLERR